MTYFLQLDGIAGDSTARGREKWIEVSSIDWGVSKSTDVAVGRGGARSGRVTVQPVSFSAPLSIATPALFLTCVQGRAVREALFEAVVDGQAGPLVTLRIELKDVLLGTLDLSGTDGEPRPTTRFSMAYGEITLTAFGVSDNGSQGDSATATWNANGR